MCFVKICDKIQQSIITSLEKIKFILKQLLRNFDSNANKSVANGNITSGFANVVGCYSNSNAWVTLVSTLRKPGHYD